MFWLESIRLSNKAVPSFSITLSILDLLFLIPKKAIKNKIEAKSKVRIITYLNLILIRNFELKKDVIFSPPMKTIYGKIEDVSRDDN
jgi:hypothetical protein